MTIYEWESAINQFAASHLEEFYQKAYPKVTLQSLSYGDSSSFRLQPCPMCGHEDCCTVTSLGLNCFSGSCSWKGSHVKAYISYAKKKLRKNDLKIQEALRDVTNIEIPVMSIKEKIEYEQFRKRQEILSIAEDFYHNQLMTCKESYMMEDGKSYTPLEYMLRVRRRSENTLKDFKVGFVKDMAKLNEGLYRRGFTDEEIKASKVWAYEGLFIFYYRNPENGYIVRFNQKNPFKIQKKKRNDDGTYVNDGVIKGYSTGSKAFYYAPGFSFDEPYIIVEGEHDMFAVYEAGFKNVCAAGGNLRGDRKTNQKFVLEKSTAPIAYTCFDNDSAGIEYTQCINEFLCDRPVSQIKFDIVYNDIDEYYRDCPKPLSIDDLIEQAVPLETETYKIRDRNGVEWFIANRETRIEFTIKKRSDANGLLGDISVIENGIVTEMYQNKLLPTIIKKYRPMAIELQRSIDKYYNRPLYSMDFEDLVKLHRFSTRKADVERRIAELMNQDTDIEPKVDQIRRILGNSSIVDTMIDEILKVRSNLKIEQGTFSASSIVPMKLSETFDLSEGKAYVYFNYHKVDSDNVIKRLPYLLRSDGELLRLDLFKKVDPESVLLIDGKFELPQEIPCAITQNEHLSLTDYWATKFIEGDIPEEELDPSYLAERLEEYIRKFYYFSDERYYKVVALYIIMTYYYELFSSVPYLYLNGEKGSGKSTLAAIIGTFAFNPKFSIDITGPALYRTVSLHGGTIILDEIESLTSRAKSQESLLASVLKGGYYKEGRIFRTVSNKDDDLRVESYTAFCPKVLCNIFGLDDVIEDRCIQIKIPKVTLTKKMKKEDLQEWKVKFQEEREEMTSKLALSALKHFKEVANIYESVFVDASSSRLSQILKPISTIARLCDMREVQGMLMANVHASQEELIGSYEKTFLDYCDDVLSFLKKNVESSTPEGIIKSCIREISKEFLGLVPEAEKEFTKAALHKYTTPIEWYPDEYKFVINALHIKTFVEESTPENRSYTLKNNKTMMNIFNLSKDDLKQKFISVGDQALISDLNNVKRPRMWEYTIHIADLYPELIAEKARAEKKIKKDIENSMSDEDDLI